jgi:hypothetical protein
MSELIKCRKCGGKHLTYKCNQNLIEEQDIIKTKSFYINENENENKNENKIIPRTQSYNTNNNNHNNNLFRSKSTPENLKSKKKYDDYYRIKILDLPIDISEEEMMNLLYGWGNIIKIKVINYDEYTIVYVDFKYKKDAEYFIKALHKTYFEDVVISVIQNYKTVT